MVSTTTTPSLVIIRRFIETLRADHGTDEVVPPLEVVDPPREADDEGMTSDPAREGALCHPGMPLDPLARADPPVSQTQPAR